jgi:hypothetical protein
MCETEAGRSKKQGHEIEQACESKRRAPESGEQDHQEGDWVLGVTKQHPAFVCMFIFYFVRPPAIFLRPVELANFPDLDKTMHFLPAKDRAS